MRLNLKMAIHENDTTQRRVARLAHTSENRLSDIVRGWADPRPYEREQIAAALGRPADLLFGSDSADVTSDAEEPRDRG